MTFVSSTSAAFADGVASVSIPQSSGDVFLAVAYSDLLRGNPFSLSWPSGWEQLGAWHEFRDATQAEQVFLAAWIRVTSAGTMSASFAWPVEHVTELAGLVVTRWSGMRAVPGVADVRMSGRSVEYPAVRAGGSPSGHAVRIAMASGSDTLTAASFVPAGHTLRHQAAGAPFVSRILRFVLSDQSLSGQAPGAASRSVSPAVAYGRGVTIYLASHLGPGAPRITSPAAADSVMDLAAAWTLAWVPDGSQAGVRVTRQTINASGGATGALQYLTSLTAPAWSTTATTISSSARSVDFPAGDFAAAGTRYRITVATVGDVLTDVGTAASVTVTSWQAPTATGVKADTVTTSGTITRRDPWLYAYGTPGAGASIDQLEVEAVEDGTGRVLARGTHTPGWWYPVPSTPEGALPNGSVFRLRGRARQRGVQWSDWYTSGLITVDAPRPDAPVVMSMPTVHPVSGLPGVAVTVTSVAGDVALYRDGVPLDTWPSDGTLTIEDYTPPTDVPVTYAATISTGSPLPEESLPATTVATLATNPRIQWLFDPLRPEGAVRVWLKEVGDITHDVRASTHLPLNSDRHLVFSMGRAQQAGSMTVQTLDRTGTESVLSLLTSGRRLILRVARERDGAGGLWPNGLTPFRPTSSPVESRPAQSAAWRAISFDWVTQ